MSENTYFSPGRTYNKEIKRQSWRTFISAIALLGLAACSGLDYTPVYCVDKNSSQREGHNRIYDISPGEQFTLSGMVVTLNEKGNLNFINGASGLKTIDPVDNDTVALTTDSMALTITTQTHEVSTTFSVDIYGTCLP